MSTSIAALVTIPALLTVVGGTAAHVYLSPAQQGLVRVRPEQDAGLTEVEFDGESWKSQLAARDLEQREAHFDRLVDLARTSADARAALEQWAQDESRPDLAWTSRLALRELSRSRDRAGVGRQWRGSDWNRLRSRFEDLERHFGDMQHGLDELFQDPNRDWHALRTPGVAPGGKSSAQSFSLEVGPDGVKCEVTEDVDGKQESRTYEAGSLEELLEAHPELKGKIGIGHGGGSHWFAPGANGRLFHFSPDGQRAPRGAPAPSKAPRTDVLGVEFIKLTPDKLQDLGLEPGLGLNVERTVPGTIAHMLGIKRGDLLIELNGTPLYGAADVSKVLTERDGTDEVVVILIDSKGQRRTLTWKPTASAERKPEQGEDSSSEF